MNKWYKLDNAAKLFPSVTNLQNSSVFRISVVLKKNIDKELLQKAVDHVYDRFPMLFVRLRKGVFWNYFDSNDNRYIVEEETDYPCKVINPRMNDGFLLKILYANYRISVEVFHSLTDGGGALELLKSIIYYYLNFSGNEFQDEGKIILAENGVNHDDIEDSFKKYYTDVNNSDKKVKDESSYRIRGMKGFNFGTNIITGSMNAIKLNETAKLYGATITSFLAGILIYSIYNSSAKFGNHKPITVAIPVNLRRVFKSYTLRNFFGVVNIGKVVTRKDTLEEVISHTNKMLKEKTTHENLEQLISNNVSLEKNPLSLFVPLFIKNLLVNIGFNYAGENKKTMALSNIGNVLLPEKMYEHIEIVEAILYPTKKSPINCAVISLDNKLTINFSKTITETDIIRHFFTLLNELLEDDINIYSNEWGDNNEV